MYRVSLTVRGSLFRHCFYVKKSTASSVQGLIDQQSQGNIVKGSEGVNFLRSEENSFAASKRGSFFQEAPRLRNQFNGDFFLQSYLRRNLSIEVRLELTHWHNHFGVTCGVIPNPARTLLVALSLACLEMSFNVKGPGAVILLFRLEYKTSVVCHNVYTKKVMHQSIAPAPRPPPPGLTPGN